MRLKKIKLAGFKSFVDPTTIPFPDDMTAVVGPNGCGKSNVIDAVRWVLGESSAKNLRGDAMTDVIFNGSTARKPVSQCSVELVFDNSSGRIQGEYAGYNELSVKRIVTKEAQSSYLLNNSKCRRRDVTDIFLGTGLGPRSYAIIEQGMISRLIESKPKELRVFIEEASGVSKYKERRRETETRIRHTKENLERLEDVRGELGQQLEKLQRQATAAKRFKELKQNERRYKAELAAIRWLKYSDKIAAMEVDIAKQDAEIEAYVASQRNEEKDISEFKQQQDHLKQQLSDVQQQVFKASTDITRIEQNQIHTKQRRQQIEQECHGLKQNIADNQGLHQENIDKINELSEQLAAVEPEKNLIEEQVEQAQDSLLEAEDHYNQHQSIGRNQTLEFNQRKQQAQSCHGKIQSLMAMQMRTQQRISELKEEFGESTDDDLSGQVQASQEEAAIVEQQIAESADSTEQSQIALDKAQQQLKQSEQKRLHHKGEQQSLEAQLAALQALQQSNKADESTQQFVENQQLVSQSWWQTLDIQPGWEQAFETITQHWQQANLVDYNGEPQTLTELAGATWLFHDQYIDNQADLIHDNCIANKLQNTHIVSWLTNIMFATDMQQALAISPQLKSYQSVVTQDGIWLGQGWMIVGSSDPQAGLLKRVNQIKELEIQLQGVKSAEDQLEQEVVTAENNLVLAKQTADTHKQQYEQQKLKLQQAQNQAQLLMQQQQQQQTRNARVAEELNRQQEINQDEQLQLEELSMQAQELEETVATLQLQQSDFEHQSEIQQQKVTDSRTQLESKKTALHQLALQLQSLQSQYDGLSSSQSRETQLLDSIQQKLGLLTTEHKELEMPLEDQQQALQQLLEQKAELDIQLQDLNDNLAEVTEKLHVAEKGQQGVTDKIQTMLAELQSVKLECEGYKVRAKAVAEQLQETKQNLKAVLEALPEDADENSWQDKLDKTLASVGRLGAVNLAAIEEYDVQAERKQHLDDQNDDLVSAVDILEQAIRKIDKETRSRFKETFDQVNEDLKMLFPKVFGGGSAYLELTDDDLLETGVTIMARPPGKKNSTIHLLSGGEKALTALSLVFAIFRLNPAPFCLLDEVDAPLDDANVARFCKLVSEMSKTVQFIFITHNKIAMEMATHLTGVTMAEPGVSRMVAVDVDEAVAIAQA